MRSGSVVIVKARGSSDSSTSSQSSGAEPEVLTYAGSAISSASSWIARATRTTCANGAPFGSRSRMHQLARAVLAPDALETHPARCEAGRVLLEETLARDPVRVAREHEQPVLQVRQQPG
jgi:hypothetical protein